MSYFPVGHRVTGGEIDDFEDCDPSHYSGGYDIDLTYGRSLPPSYQTCYPYRSSASDPPQFAPHSVYDSYSGPKARPGPPATAGGRGYSGPKPNYGFQPGGGVFEHGGRNEYARPEPVYGPGYSMEPPSSKFGSSYGRSSEYENPSLMHGNPGSRPDYGDSGYGPGASKPVSRYDHGGWPEKPSYPEPSFPMPSYSDPNYPIPSYPEPNYPIPSYPEPSYPMPSYPEPRYPTSGYGSQKYEHDNSDYEERKHRHTHRHGHHYRPQ